MKSDSRSRFALGLSLVEVMLLVVFAAMMMYVTDSVEGKGQDARPIVEEPQQGDSGLQAKLDAAAEKSRSLEQQLTEMTLMMNEVKLMVGAKGSTKEGFQEAIDDLKRGYALCQKDGNTLIEASMQHGEETVHVIGEIPSELKVSLGKGEQTSDLEEIVAFLQDVYQYEKDQSCRFNYRLKYATDNDYRKAREVFERYFYPEKMIKTG
jgi:archaellum component FlaC